MKVKEWIRAATDMILPRYCAVCGRTLLVKEDHLCLECAMKMPLTYFWTEKINPMADKFNERTGNTYAYAVALFLYRGKYRGLTKSVKYKCNVELGKYLGAALGRKISACPWMTDVDVVVPVPLHWLRKIVRGYNQAEIVARGVTSGAGGKPSAVCWKDGKPTLNTDVLVRRRRTKSQARLHMSQKEKNVAGAFEGHMESLTERPSHILLVDDVFTSGSTLCECQRALSIALISRFGEEGLKTRISIATLAYVGD